MSTISEHVQFALIHIYESAPRGIHHLGFRNAQGFVEYSFLKTSSGIQTLRLKTPLQFETDLITQIEDQGIALLYIKSYVSTDQSETSSTCEVRALDLTQVGYQWAKPEDLTEHMGNHYGYTYDENYFICSEW